MADPRLGEAIRLFNDADWYGCHDGFEELWHETAGPMRPVLQGILQLAVAELHLERGNHHGAMVLMGEGLGRLASCGEDGLGCDLVALALVSRLRLAALQAGQTPIQLPLPKLLAAQQSLPNQARGTL